VGWGNARVSGNIIKLTQRGFYALYPVLLGVFSSMRKAPSPLLFAKSNELSTIVTCVGALYTSDRNGRDFQPVLYYMSSKNKNIQFQDNLSKCKLTRIHKKLPFKVHYKVGVCFLIDDLLRIRPKITNIMFVKISYLYYYLNKKIAT
jgi:hypothetical protein